MPKFSVIIQSYLGEYHGAATAREDKIIRAINSVLNQSLQDFEIIIVADGCDKTFDIIWGNYGDHEKVDCFQIKKQPIWSGSPRNFGIEKASGEYIVYLDIDDYLGADHLKKISEQLESFDWVFWNDYVMTKDLRPIERLCIINHKFQNNTSNICHKKSLNVKWGGGAYGVDDWSLVQALLSHPNNKKINPAQYYVCHIPNRLDV